MTNAQLSLAIKVVEAYILTNKDYIEDKAVLEAIMDLSGCMSEELRLKLRTVMLVVIDDKPTFVDITDFYDLQISYDNEVDPSVLQTLCDLMYPDKASSMLGYADILDDEYWEQSISCLTCSNDLAYSIRDARKQWIKENR